jgi:signal transduction histidine kinase
LINQTSIIKQAAILTSNRDFYEKFRRILKKHNFQVERISLKKKLELPALFHSDLFLIDNELNYFPFHSFFENLNHQSQKSFTINIGTPPPADLNIPGNLISLASQENDSFPKILACIDQLLRREKLQHELSSMLLHDIRSPLNSLIGYLELLISGTFGKLDEGHRNILEKSIELGDDTLDLLEELSDVYMYEQDAFTLQKQAVDLTNVIESVLRTVWVKADKKNIKITKKIPQGLNQLWGDEFQIQRLLLNILMNAINYSPENSAIILDVQPFDEKSILISVKDNGRGLPEQELSHLFKKYYRFPQKKNPKGHGLGLFISKIITEAHGGKIWAENQATGGLAIHITLPISLTNSNNNQTKS